MKTILPLIGFGYVTLMIHDFIDQRFGSNLDSHNWMAIGIFIGSFATFVYNGYKSHKQNDQ